MQDSTVFCVIIVEIIKKEIRNEKEKSVMDKCTHADTGRM